MAVWLDSGGQLLQPGSSMLRVDAKVWYRCDGRVAGRRCAVHHKHMATTKEGQRDEVGGGFPSRQNGTLSCFGGLIQMIFDKVFFRGLV